jgi:hypothetical protein
VQANPVELPPEFTQSLQRRAASILDLKKTIDSVPESSREELRKMIEEKFRVCPKRKAGVEGVEVKEVTDKKEMGRKSKTPPAHPHSPYTHHPSTPPTQSLSAHSPTLCILYIN